MIELEAPDGKLEIAAKPDDSSWSIVGSIGISGGRRPYGRKVRSSLDRAGPAETPADPWVHPGGSSTETQSAP